MALTDVYSYEFAKSKLFKYLQKQDEIMESQEYKIANRTQRRALLSEVEAVIGKWEKIIDDHIKLDPTLSVSKTKKVRTGPTISTIGYRP